MKKGIYYVGDLAYVLSDEAWTELIALMYPDRRTVCRPDGHFTLRDGRKLWLHGTAYGDGGYPASDGSTISVDSGTIGCVLIDDVDKTELISGHATVRTMPEGFEPEYCDGTFTFADLTVTTGDDDEPEYCDWCDGTGEVEDCCEWVTCSYCGGMGEL